MLGKDVDTMKKYTNVSNYQKISLTASNKFNKLFFQKIIVDFYVNFPV